MLGCANSSDASFDIHASSLPNAIRDRLLSKRGRRISSARVIIIKAQRFRAI